MWVYGIGAYAIENSEEGNWKIVDGVIKVGSVASSGTPWCCPIVPQVAKSGRGVASPEARTTIHYLYVGRMTLCRHARVSFDMTV